MHALPPHDPPQDNGAPTGGQPGERVWVIAGTGEGPLLAQHLRARGWRLRVSVVTAAAARSYPRDPGLEVLVGALAGASAWREALEAAERQGDPFRWIIDASHPFATRVTAAAVAASRHRPEGLLRLHRPLLPTSGATLLWQLADIQQHLARDERLLLAIGARHLATAVGHSQQARHHSRVLPHPRAIREALRAGLPPHRLACVHPSGDGAVERALCQLWGIDTILCRQSGSRTEALWLRISAELGLRLLLVRRPREPEGVVELPLAELIARVGWSPRGGDQNEPMDTGGERHGGDGAGA